MRPERHLYLRLREQIACLILSGRCGDGERLPSVRALAAEAGANPLTVAKAYQLFVESGVVEMRRGVGLFVAEGGGSNLRQIERSRFLNEEWPLIEQEMKRLQLSKEDLAKAMKRASELPAQGSL